MTNDPQYWYTAVFRHRMTDEKVTMEVKAANDQEASTRSWNMVHGVDWKRTLLERGGEVMQ